MKLMCGGRGPLLFKKLITNVKWKGNAPICIFMAWISNESHVDVDWQGFLFPYFDHSLMEIAF